jgi:hypothetical protein
MRTLDCVLVIGAALLAVYGVRQVLVSREPAPAAEQTTAGARAPHDLGAPPRGAGASGHDHEVSPAARAPAASRATREADPPDLAAWLTENPLSRSPHEVTRAWGGRPGASTGPVGLRVVVSPNLPTSALEQLVRDMRGHYGNADIFSVLVYDSEEAAQYDRHIDGGALAKRHLVARVVRDRSLGEDTIEIRGMLIEP